MPQMQQFLTLPWVAVYDRYDSRVTKLLQNLTEKSTFKLNLTDQNLLFCNLLFQTLSLEEALSFSFMLSFSMGAALQRKEFASTEENSLLSDNSFLEGFPHSQKQAGSHKNCLFSFVFFSFNPIALRKTKIVYNFGLCDCSRVK